MNCRQKRHLLDNNLFNLLTKTRKFAYEEKAHKRQQKRGKDIRAIEHKRRKGSIKFSRGNYI